MEDEKNIIIHSKIEEKNKIKSKGYQGKKLFCYFILIILFINIEMFFFFFNNYKKSNMIINNLKSDIMQNKLEISNLQKSIEDHNDKIIKLKYETIDQKIILDYILNNITNNNITEKSNIINNISIIEKSKLEQNDFCNNIKKYSNLEFENQIRLVNIKFESKNFNLYVYKNNDIVSNTIYSNQQWEEGETRKLLNSLKYYAEKRKIKNEDIFILDIGSNIGWYTFILGKYGYNVISFEPSEVNNYILKKNYCLNKELNITLISQGLYNTEKKCDFYISKGNIGDGWVFCDKRKKIPIHLKKIGVTKLTTLSNYIPFLFKRNLALIKIDVEGSEEKVLEGGIEIISEYHVPFIFLEFTPDSLKDHGTNPKKFLKIFEENGYKFSMNSFLDTNFITIDDIIKKCKSYINLYIIYSKF